MKLILENVITGVELEVDSLSLQCFLASSASTFSSIIGQVVIAFDEGRFVPGVVISADGGERQEKPEWLQHHCWARLLIMGHPDPGLSKGVLIDLRVSAEDFEYHGHATVAGVQLEVFLVACAETHMQLLQHFGAAKTRNGLEQLKMRAEENVKWPKRNLHPGLLIPSLIPDGLQKAVEESWLRLYIMGEESDTVHEHQDNNSMVNQWPDGVQPFTEEERGCLSKGSVYNDEPSVYSFKDNNEACNMAMHFWAATCKAVTAADTWKKQSIEVNQAIGTAELELCQIEGKELETVNSLWDLGSFLTEHQQILYTEESQLNEEDRITYIFPEGTFYLSRAAVEDALDKGSNPQNAFLNLLLAHCRPAALIACNTDRKGSQQNPDLHAFSEPLLIALHHQLNIYGERLSNGYCGPTNALRILQFGGERLTRDFLRPFLAQARNKFLHLGRPT